MARVRSRGSSHTFPWSPELLLSRASGERGLSLCLCLRVAAGMGAVGVLGSFISSAWPGPAGRICGSASQVACRALCLSSLPLVLQLGGACCSLKAGGWTEASAAWAGRMGRPGRSWASEGGGASWPHAGAWLPLPVPACIGSMSFGNYVTQNLRLSLRGSLCTPRAACPAFLGMCVRLD